jgi:predicted carbohydrate-binding protein with CBM5 and CBM33 domain
MKNYLIIIGLFLLLGGGLLSSPHPLFATETAVPVVQQQGYTVLAGEWQRTDGSYFIKVSNVYQDGKAMVEYFNPKPIHVEQSAISTQNDLIKLFIRLRDTGYEGSTYTLYYYAEKDALAGFYYHATMDRTYEVIFMRKNN